MSKKNVGIDLGGCESAATVVLRLPEGGYEIRSLKLNGENLIIHTQILLTKSQMEKIGERINNGLALDFEFLEALEAQTGEIRIGDVGVPNTEDEAFANFKRPPRQFDRMCGKSRAAKDAKITHGILMMCFVYALVRNMLRDNDVTIISEADRKDISLMIGCPSTPDWTGEEENKKYAELVRLVTGAESVEIIPESRAAMFSSIEDERNKISAANGAVVYDFGSSTADCTYMHLGKTLMEFSWRLGAALIEEKITDYALETLVEDGKLSREELDDISYATRRNAEEISRGGKETYYNGGYEGNNCDNAEITLRFRKSSQPDAKPIKQDVEFLTPLMEHVTGQMFLDNIDCNTDVQITDTWQGFCRRLFVTTKRMLEEKKLPVSTIVLTGGASKMGFVRTICAEVFGGDVEIVVESSPSHTVSKGLGWIALLEKKTDECKKRVKDAASCGDLMPNRFKEKVMYDLFEKIKAIFDLKVDVWRLSQTDLSISDLKKSVKEAFADEGNKQTFDRVIAKNVNEWNNKLANVIKDAVNQQANELYSEKMSGALTIPEEMYEELKMGIDLSGIDISKVVASYDFQSFGDWLWALGHNLWVWVFGGKQMETSDVDETKKRTSQERSQAANSIKEHFAKQKDVVLQDVGKQIDNVIKDYDHNLCNIAGDAIDIITLKKFERVFSAEETKELLKKNVGEI